MRIAFSLVDEALHGALIAGSLYTGTVALVTIAAVFAPTPERRRDARATLRVLLRRRDR